MIRLRIRELLSCVGIVSLSIVGAPVCADEPEPLGVVTLQSSTEIIGDGAGLAVDPGGTIDSEMRAGAAINQVLMNWNGFPTIAARGPFCGDGIVNGDETCDDGNDINGDTCRNDCSFCGDGLINGDEFCDFNDPNAPPDCSDECLPDEIFCGDGGISPGETCEPPGAPAGASGNECRNDCTVCGDGVIHPGEFCDDGNNIDGDGCRNDCTACGDGVVDPASGETCEPPGQPIGSGNLVLDGSFEAGTPNPFWTEFSTTFGTTLCDPASCGFDLGVDGAWWSWFGGTNDAEEGILSQSIDLPEGANATLNFGLWLITCNADPDDFFEVAVNGDVVFSVDMTDARCDNVFYSLEAVDLSAYAGQSITLQFRSVTGSNGTGANIFLDAISLEVFQDDLCREDCTYCGDGVVDSGEACDDGNDIDSDMCRNDCTESPLLVELKSFTAEVVKSGVLLHWSTYSERETLGFRLWRSGPTPTAGRSRTLETALHTGMIFGRGSEIEGAEYRFLDNAQLQPGTYVYYLEDVDNLGAVTRHDPVSVEIENRRSPRFLGTGVRQRIADSDHERADRGASGNPSGGKGVDPGQAQPGARPVVRLVQLRMRAPLDQRPSHRARWSSEVPRGE